MLNITLTPIEKYEWNEISPYISLALKKVDDYSNQRHIGILHKRINEDPFLLHLEWHHINKNEALNEIISDNYHIYVPSYLDTEKSRTIAGLCRRIAKRKHKIPYGIIFDGTNFSKDGILHLGKKSHGLTCATFVLAIFLSNGMELLLEDQWPSREEDIVWHSQIIKNLEDTKEFCGITDEHINNIRDEKGCTRFKPEEVAGSLSSKKLPVSFNYAEKAGNLIVQQL